MQRLIKNGELTENSWQNAGIEDFNLALLKEGQWLLPLNVFLLAAEQDLVDYARCGLLLNSDQSLDEVEPHIGKLSLIALDFKAFADGRSFSQARMLREQFDYSGELRAIGEFILDQLFYLSRCGVDAFALPEGTTVESARQSLADFSESYQAACDEAQPLFRRRA